MSSIYNKFGQFSTNSASINNPNSGFLLTNGSDAIGAQQIGNIGNNFANTITTVSSPNAYRIAPGDRIPNNIDAVALQRVTPTSLRTATTFAPSGLVRLQSSPFPFFQPVPELGRNPDALTLLSASTQFQADLQTVGPVALPGFPVLDLDHNADHIDSMGVTQSFMNSIVPFYPLADLSGAYLPGAQGGGYYYAPPNVHPGYEFGPFQATNYKQFTPVSFTPSSIATNTNRISANTPNRISSTLSSFNGYPISYTAYPGLAESMTGGYSNGIKTKKQKAKSKGKFNQGKVNSPFGSSFLKKASPVGNRNSSTGVTPANTNGFFKGSAQADVIQTNPFQKATVDGQGGGDTIYTGTAGDAVSVHQGDQVFTNAGTDLLYFNFTQQPLTSKTTVMDGGNGFDSLVMSVPGDPTDPGQTPTFTRQSDGSIKIVLNGITLLTRNIESFVITDRKGNVGQSYNTSTGLNITS